MYIKLLKIISEAFKETVTIEFKRNKIWWTEQDLIGSFYHKIRPKIDQLDNYGICWEWRVNKGTKNDPRVDLVVAEFTNPEKDMIEATPIIAIEFKWGQKERKEVIEKDAKKLTSMIRNECDSTELDLGDGIKRINKGDKPKHAILFIADASYKKDRRKMRQFYEGLHSKYPLVDVIFAFPLNHKLNLFE